MIVYSKLFGCRRVLRATVTRESRTSLSWRRVRRMSRLVGQISTSTAAVDNDKVVFQDCRLLVSQHENLPVNFQERSTLRSEIGLPIIVRGDYVEGNIPSPAPGTAGLTTHSGI